MKGKQQRREWENSGKWQWVFREKKNPEKKNGKEKIQVGIPADRMEKMERIEGMGVVGHCRVRELGCEWSDAR